MSAATDARAEGGAEAAAAGPEAEFTQWLERRGCDLRRVRWPARDARTGVRGVAAAEKIAAFETIFEVPGDLIISVDLAKSHAVLGEFLRRCEHKAPLSEPARMLTVWLAYERMQGAASAWKPYLDSLPREADFEDFVDAWSDADLEALDDAVTARLAVGARADVRWQLSQLRDLLQAYLAEEEADIEPGLAAFAQALTPATYRWAFWNVESRTFLDRRSVESALPVLIPFADMLNHHPTRADAAEFEPNSFLMVADRELGPGDMLFNSYGRRTNRELLLTYGFVLLDNPWERCGISLPWAALSPERVADDLVRAKVSVISQFPDSDFGHLFLRGGVDERLLAYFRVWCARDMGELRALRSAGLEPISVDLERLALDCFLARVCPPRGPAVPPPPPLPPGQTGETAPQAKSSRLQTAHIYAETRRRIRAAHSDALERRRAEVDARS